MTPVSHHGRRLARRGLVTSIASRVIGRSIGLVLVVLRARRADAGTAALYGYLLGTASLVAVLTDLGVAVVAAREVADGRLPARAALFAALLPQTVSVAAAALITLGLTLVAGPPGLRPAALLLTVAIVVATFTASALANDDADMPSTWPPSGPHQPTASAITATPGHASFPAPTRLGSH